jgi:predicted RNA binding protein YcfA (HicA-like mRNA interferase family)
VPKLPVVSGREVVKALSIIGYEVDHQTGNHIILRLSSPPYRRLTVPNHKELAKGTLRGIIEDASLTWRSFDDYFEPAGR